MWDFRVPLIYLLILDSLSSLSRICRRLFRLLELADILSRASWSAYSCSPYYLAFAQCHAWAEQVSKPRNGEQKTLDPLIFLVMNVSLYTLRLDWAASDSIGFDWIGSLVTGCLSLASQKWGAEVSDTFIISPIRCCKFDFATRLFLARSEQSGKDSMKSFDGWRSSCYYTMSPEKNRRLKRDMCATNSNYHNLNVVLDCNSVGSIKDNGFSRAVATMARGTLKHTKKEYSPFRETIFAAARANSAVSNTYISRESDYHALETKRHWEKSSGNRSVFQSGTHSPGRKFPSISSLLGSQKEAMFFTNGKLREDDNLMHRSKSFRRAKTPIFQEIDHNSEILSKHVS